MGVAISRDGTARTHSEQRATQRTCSRLWLSTVQVLRHRTCCTTSQATAPRQTSPVNPKRCTKHAQHNMQLGSGRTVGKLSHPYGISTKHWPSESSTICSTCHQKIHSNQCRLEDGSSIWLQQQGSGRTGGKRAPTYGISTKHWPSESSTICSPCHHKIHNNQCMLEDGSSIWLQQQGSGRTVGSKLSQPYGISTEAGSSPAAPTTLPTVDGAACSSAGVWSRPIKQGVWGRAASSNCHVGHTNQHHQTKIWSACHRV